MLLKTGICQHDIHYWIGSNAKQVSSDPLCLLELRFKSNQYRKKAVAEILSMLANDLQRTKVGIIITVYEKMIAGSCIRLMQLQKNHWSKRRKNNSSRVWAVNSYGVISKFTESF